MNIETLCPRCGNRFIRTAREMTYCPDCLHTIRQQGVIRDHVCIDCGISFTGGAGAKRCPSCARIIRNQRTLEIMTFGAKRHIGGIYNCAKCGSEYTMTGGSQRYCPECAAAEIRENKNRKCREYAARKRSENKELKKQLKIARDIALDKAKKGKNVMTSKKFYYALGEAQNYTDRDAFISDVSLSSVWDDAEDAEIPASRIAYLGELYDAAHRTVKDISAASGRSVRDIGMICGISYNTIQDWSQGRRKPPVYVPILIQIALGMLESPINVE